MELELSDHALELSDTKDKRLSAFKKKFTISVNCII